jgi:hypothetical protein
LPLDIRAGLVYRRQPRFRLIPALPNQASDNMMTPIFGGMDFGTSNSTVAIMRGGRPELAPLEDGHATLPSARRSPTIRRARKGG